ncbi:MAG: aquaporin [Balneolaceae bacterium]
MGKLLSEGFGTFLLTIVVALSANPLAVGLMIVAIIYMLAPFSETHFNPAVSVAAWLRGKIDVSECIESIGGQVIGAFLGAVVSGWVATIPFVPSPDTGTPHLAFALLEFLFSVALITLFLIMLYPKTRRKNPAYGVIIGLGIAGLYLAAEQAISIGLNPALSGSIITTQYLQMNASFTYVLVYLLAPLIAALPAAWIHKRMELM